MRICFIKNKKKSERTSILNSNGKIFNYKLLLIVIITEIIGALFITYISNEHIFDIDVYCQYYLSSMSSEIINNEKYFLYQFLRYCKEAVIMTILNFTSLRTAANYIFIIYKVCFFSISLGILIIKYGILGQVKFMLTLFPQGIIYYLFFYFLINRDKNNFQTGKKDLANQVIVSTLIAVFVSAITALMETYINLKIIYRIFT